MGNKIEILLSWADSLPQHHIVLPPCPLPLAYRHTHIKPSTHRNPQTFWQPSSTLPVWSGRVKGSGMTTWQLWYLSTRSPWSRAAWSSGCFPGGKWPVSEGGLCLSNQRTAEAWRRYLLGATLLLSSWQTTEEEGGVTRRLIICIRMRLFKPERDRNRSKEVMNEKVNLI